MSLFQEHHHPRHPCELYIRIREIKVKDGYDKIPACSLDAWKPPLTKSAFEVVRGGAWLRWNHGSIVPVELIPENLQRGDETSLFWDPDPRVFVQGPFDCMNFDFADNREDSWRYWGPIRFEKSGQSANGETYQYLWRIGHLLRKLRVDMPMTPPWEDLLGPSYFERTNTPSTALPFCGFAGQLSLILGLFALAVTWDGLENVLTNCFLPVCGDTAHYDPLWSNIYPGAKHLRRGVIVEVAYDEKEISQQSIEAWKLGTWGPILTSSSSSSNQPLFGF